MTAFTIALWFALSFGSFAPGTSVVQAKAGCLIDPNGGCTKSTGEIVWADEASTPPTGGDTADGGSHIDPNGGT